MSVLDKEFYTSHNLCNPTEQLLPVPSLAEVRIIGRHPQSWMHHEFWLLFGRRCLHTLLLKHLLGLRGFGTMPVRA